MNVSLGSVYVCDKVKIVAIKVIRYTSYLKLSYKKLLVRNMDNEGYQVVGILSFNRNTSTLVSLDECPA
jgi:hypothetical protein